ncbi:MAG: hypothetical protein KDA87_09255 [Planctomycetales bacterium]|nr:hypothetical protein [Planctomycetales bacterium]
MSSFSLLTDSAFAQETPAAPTPTIFSFLGIPQGAKKVHGALFNRKGKHPKLEKKPPLKALNDPANLESEWPAIKKAAEVKMAEDAAQQKIKGVKYLTEYGCGCYDSDGSVTEAIVATLTDCTESVRVAAIEAVADAARGKCCNNCGQVCCCNEDILKTLARIAYERDETGCYLEASKRVREAAAGALALCCRGRGPVEEEMPEPEKDAEPEDEPEGTDASSEDEPEGAVDETDSDTDEVTPDALESIKKTEDDFTFNQFSQADVQLQPYAQLIETTSPAAASSSILRQPQSIAGDGVVKVANNWMAQQDPSRAVGPASERGHLLHIDPARQLAHVHFESHDVVPATGTLMNVMRNGEAGAVVLGLVEVTETYPGSANVKAIKGDFSKLVRGDVVVPAPVVAEAPHANTANANRRTKATRTGFLNGKRF